LAPSASLPTGAVPAQTQDPADRTSGFVPEGDVIDSPPLSPVELSVMASRIKPMSWAQHGRIRAAAIALGVPASIASALPWLAADPGKVITALSNPDPEILGKTLCRTITTNVLVAGILRAFENIRLEETRYEGGFALDRYTAVEDNSALMFTHDKGNGPATMNDLYAQVAAADTAVEQVNPYGDDIACHGIRLGGTLFPLVARIKGLPLLGAFETADCYGRTLFAQQAAAIAVGRDASRTLEWVLSALTQSPLSGQEYSRHPLKKSRDRVLAIAGKVQAGHHLSAAETTVLATAVMPATRIVLTVDRDVTIDEVRRRFVSQQHLEPQTPFSDGTERQARGVAVLTVLKIRGRLPAVADVDAEEIATILDQPRIAVGDRVVHADDVAALAAAALLPAYGTVSDRLIPVALETRGTTTGPKGKYARSGVAAEIITRLVPRSDEKVGRRSALDRALRLSQLRGVCPRTIRSGEAELAALLDDAQAELASFLQDRVRDQKSAAWGPSMKELAVRGAYWMTCAPKRPITLDRSPIGGVSPVGAGEVGSLREPNQILERLATTPWGLHQLAQVIFDGRTGVDAREVPSDGMSTVAINATATGDEHAAIGTGAPTGVSAEHMPSGVLSAKTLRSRTGQPVAQTDQAAKARFAAAGDRLYDEAQAVSARIESMTKIADKGSKAYVLQNGWSDPKNVVQTLKEAADQVSGWVALRGILQTVATDTLTDDTGSDDIDNSDDRSGEV